MADLAPNPKLHFETAAGLPAVGWKLYTYAAGTTTPQATYVDSAGGVANANPVIMDARGECIVYGATNYKFVLKDNLDNLIWTRDNVDVTPFATAASLTALTTLLASSTGSAQIGFLQSGSGALLMTAQTKMRQSVSVTDFTGVDTTGATDSTAGINNALATGLLVYFPPGTYKITGTLNVTQSGQHLQGAGWGAATLNFANGTGDCVTFIGTAGTHIAGCQINGFTFTHTAKTGGRSMVFSYADRCTVSDIYLVNAWTGIEGYITNNLTLENVFFQGVTGGASVPAFLGAYSPGACYGIYWHAPGDNSQRSDALSLTNVVVQCAPTGTASGADGFIWDGLAQTCNVFQFTSLGCRYGMRVLNSAASGSYWPGYLIADNFNTENSTKSGVRIEGGRGFEFVNSIILNTSGSATVGSADLYAFEALADVAASITSQISIANSVIGQSTKNAVWCAARDLQVTNVTFQAGSATPNNTYPAVQIASPAQDVIISQTKIASWGAAVTWKYGIQVDSGTTRVALIGNQLSNAVTTAIAWSNTDQGSFCANNTSTNPARPVAITKTVVGATTLTGIELLSQPLLLSGTPGAFNLTTPTAAQIVAACQNPYYYQSIIVPVVNNTNGTASILANTGISLAGNTFTMLTATQRTFTVVLTNTTPGAETVVIYG